MTKKPYDFDEEEDYEVSDDDYYGDMPIYG